MTSLASEMCMKWNGNELWETLAYDPKALLTASMHWRCDERFILRALEHGAPHEVGQFIFLRPAALRAAELCGGTLRYHLFYKDKEVVMAALRNDPTAIQYASPDLHNDKDCALLAMSSPEGARLLHTLSFTMRDDPDVVREALSHYGLALLYANPRFSKDREFVRLAMQHSKGQALMCSPLEASDFELVVEAIHLNPHLVRTFLGLWPGQECTLAQIALVDDPTVYPTLPEPVRWDDMVRYTGNRVDGKELASTLSLDRLEDLSNAAALKGDEDLVAHLEHPESRLFVGKRKRDYEEECVWE